ncbi:MAG: hypothetical protein M1379_03850 [Firmicutes bacterium]|nr:hypothetical protein [Bacillota bacterium]
MANRRQKTGQAGPNQISLFDFIAEAAVVQENRPQPGSLVMGPQVKELLSQALKKTSFKRWEIAGRMGEYADAEITESMLNSWTADSKEGHRFPVEYLPAFCWATGDYELIEAIVKACGCYLIKSEEVVLLELARIDEKKRQLQQREKQVRQYLDQMRKEVTP